MTKMYAFQSKKENAFILTDEERNKILDYVSDGESWDRDTIKIYLDGSIRAQANADYNPGCDNTTYDTGFNVNEILGYKKVPAPYDIVEV